MRMKRWIQLFCILLAATLASRGATADDASLRQELKVEYMKADAAMRTKNLRGLMYRYSTDFTLKLTPNKTLTRAAVEDSMGWTFVATKEIKDLSFTIL